MIGKIPARFVHPDDLNQYIRSLRGRTDIGERTQEIRVKNKSGEWIWLQFRGRIIQGKDGERKILLISRDITEKKLMELESLIQEKIQFFKKFPRKINTLKEWELD